MTEKYPLYFKLTMVFTGIFFFFAIMSFARIILIPIAVAVLFAIILFPFYREMIKLRVPNVLSIIISILLLFIFLAGIITIFILQFIEFSAHIPFLLNEINIIFVNIQLYVENRFNIDTAEMTDDLIQMAEEFLTVGVRPFIGDTLARVTSLMIGAGVAPIYTFLLLYYHRLFKDFIAEITPGERNGKIRTMINEGSRVVQSYIGGTVMVMIILGFVYTIILFILGVDFPLFFGVTAAVLTIVPYIGVFIGTALPILYTLFITDSLILPILIVVIFNTIQFLEGSYLSPYIIGNDVRLNPVAVIIALFLGVMVWGIMGLLLFIPYLVMFKIFLKQSERTKPYAQILEGYRRRSLKLKRKKSLM